LSLGISVQRASTSLCKLERCWRKPSQDVDGNQGEEEEGGDQRTGRVFVDVDDEVEQVNGGESQIVRIHDGSEDEVEDEE